MGKTLTEKLIAAHLVSGSMEPGAEVALRIDQTLTQDAYCLLYTSPSPRD